MSAVDRALQRWVPDTKTGCYLYCGAMNESGMPMVRVRFGRKAASRVAYERDHGPIPEGMYVRHHCGETSCINPAHLFLAPFQRSTVTVEQVVAIRSAKATGRALAAQYGVTEMAISLIRRRKTWRDVA